MKRFATYEAYKNWLNAYDMLEDIIYSSERRITGKEMLAALGYDCEMPYEGEANIHSIEHTKS